MPVLWGISAAAWDRATSWLTQIWLELGLAHSRGPRPGRPVVADVTCDVLVVGGGIAGVSVGAYLAAERRVLLVEAEQQLAVHATGRSAAAYLPSYGGPEVRLLTGASRTGYTEMSQLAGVELLTSRPLLWLAGDVAGRRQLETLSRQAAGLEWLTPAQARDVCPVLRPEAIAAAALDIGGMDIEVAGLHAAYRRLLTSRGGVVEPAARLQHASRTAAGWRVDCGQLTVECPVLVDAAGAWVDEVARRCGVRPLGAQPCRRSAAIAPLPDHVADSRNWPLVTDAHEQFYFRPDGGALLVSPAEETPVEAGDARPDELAIALALERVNAATSLGLRSISRAWAGLRTFVPDRMPVLGAWPDEPGFSFVAAQGGYGIQMAPALAALAAQTLGVGAAPLCAADAAALTRTLAPSNARFS